ncbi:four-helix bundle copper-binding protein [Sphingomonas sp. 1P06PA]|uniref:four-helix bundle copper-binding protein n=1 Tax=Sphingomonas sp. 1P06PA TaxID=554121 RepID=UPI0039A4C441
MSIHKMIQSHPDVGADFNDALATAARHAMFCAVICTSCADACTAEAMDTAQCVRTCSDCADICTATARVAVRRAGQNIFTMRALFEACIVACDICAEECARHDHEHCRQCAEMCRECARDCRAALPTIQ